MNFNKPAGLNRMGFNFSNSQSSSIFHSLTQDPLDSPTILGQVCQGRMIGGQDLAIVENAETRCLAG